jgi:hypothetical protein
MKYFVFVGDYTYDLEMHIFETSENVKDFISENDGYEVIKVIKGEEVKVKKSYHLEE